MKADSEIFLDVDVTQEDIDRGRRWDETYCPLGLALSRAVEQKYGKVCLTFVAGDRMRFCLNDTWYACLHTPATQKFIDAFDAGYKVYPDEFRLTFSYDYSTSYCPHC